MLGISIVLNPGIRSLVFVCVYKFLFFTIQRIKLIFLSSRSHRLVFVFVFCASAVMGGETINLRQVGDTLDFLMLKIELQF